MKIRSFFIFFFLIITAGCVTGGVVIRETPLNVSDTRKVVTSVIGVPINISENGRELYSNFYDARGQKIEKPEAVRARLQTVVIILGDRRPYDIQVLVNKQVKSPEGRFEFYERDDVRAEDIAEKIRKALNQSRGQRNVIDDFRSF